MRRHVQLVGTLLMMTTGATITAAAPTRRALPIWSFPGAANPVIPGARSLEEAVRSAGGRPLSADREGGGHDLRTPAYRDAATLDWLFRQRRRSGPGEPP